MTNEEAIELLDILKVFDAPDLSEAIRMAKDALMEQSPSDKSHWNIRCETHRDNHTGETDEQFYLECPLCGRKVWDVNDMHVLGGQYDKLLEAFPFCHCGAKMLQCVDIKE